MLIEIGLSLVTLLLVWYLYDHIRFRGYPPGPLRLPLLGNLVHLGYYAAGSISKTPSCIMHRLSKVYGEVMHVRMGVIDFVVFSSYSSITELLSLEGLGNRKTFQYYLDRNDNGNVGLITSNGPTWHTLRRFTIRTLREFGFGKSSSMDSVISEEAAKFIAHLKAKSQISQDQDQAVLHVPGDLFDATVVNVLWRLVTGKSHELDDPWIKEMLRLSNEYIRSITVDDITVCYPRLRDWFPHWSGRVSQVECVRQLKEFLQEGVVQEHSAGDGSYVGVFLEKMEETNGKDEAFNSTQLIYTLLDLFQAGSETTSKTLTFFLLHMVRNPLVQERVHAELDAADISEEASSLRNALPYTNAVILETLRFSDVVPIPGPYECYRDLHFRGHLIKAGTALMCNLEAVHYDDKLWGDPYTFRPERFIISGQDGVTRLNSDLSEFVVPFGKGKRACPGQTLTEATLFRYFISLFRQFRFEAVGNSTVVPKPGLTYTPETFKVRMIRTENK